MVLFPCFPLDLPPAGTNASKRSGSRPSVRYAKYAEMPKPRTIDDYGDHEHFPPRLHFGDYAGSRLNGEILLGLTGAGCLLRDTFESGGYFSVSRITTDH